MGWPFHRLITWLLLWLRLWVMPKWVFLLLSWHMCVILQTVHSKTPGKYCRRVSAESSPPQGKSSEQGSSSGVRDGNAGGPTWPSCKRQLHIFHLRETLTLQTQTPATRVLSGIPRGLCHSGGGIIPVGTSVRYSFYWSLSVRRPVRCFVSIISFNPMTMLLNGYHYHFTWENWNVKRLSNLSEITQLCTEGLRTKPGSSDSKVLALTISATVT